MLFKFILASLGCLAVAVCVAKLGANPPAQEIFSREGAENPIVPVNDMTTQKQQQWRDFVESHPEYNSSPLIAPPPLSEPNQYSQNRQDSPPAPMAARQSIPTGNYMKLVPTDRTNALGNPLYKLELYAHGKLIGTYKAVTGRAHTQTRNRHQAGTNAPLPDGTYRVARSAIPGTNPEVGGRFLPIQPTFATARSALGIHFDPSFEKDKKEDGTEGCIALTNRDDLDQVLKYVRDYRPQYLEVSIQP